jgi:hypothetical protein
MSAQLTTDWLSKHIQRLNHEFNLNGFFGGPLVGVFLAGMLIKRTLENPAFIGLCGGFAFAIYLGFFMEISSLLYGTFAAATTTGLTRILSFFLPPNTDPQL